MANVFRRDERIPAAGAAPAIPAFSAHRQRDSILDFPDADFNAQNPHFPHSNVNKILSGNNLSCRRRRRKNAPAQNSPHPALPAPPLRSAGTGVTPKGDSADVEQRRPEFFVREGQQERFFFRAGSRLPARKPLQPPCIRTARPGRSCRRCRTGRPFRSPPLRPPTGRR